MSHRNTVYAEHPQIMRLERVSVDGLRSSGSVSNSSLGNSFSARMSWMSGIATNSSYTQLRRKRNHDLVERQLLAFWQLPYEAESGDIRPTKLALAYAFMLVSYLEKADLDLSELDIAPTDNRTIEFSLRRDRYNELSFETGSNGISGNMYIHGGRFAANTYDESTTTQQDHIIEHVRQFRQTGN